MDEKIPDLTHEITNKLNGVCTIAGCLVDRLKDEPDLSGSLKDELTKALRLIENKIQEASGELNKIKLELQSRGQYI